MADQDKTTPQDPKATHTIPTQPFLNLELTEPFRTKPSPLDEPIEVAEVVDEEHTLVDVGEPLPIVDSVEDILEVVEEDGVEVAAPSTDVSKIELVEDVQEILPIDEGVDFIDDIAEDKGPAPKTSPPVSKDTLAAPQGHATAKQDAPTIAPADAGKAAQTGEQWDVTMPLSKTPSEDDIFEVLEATPSGSSIVEAALVEEDVEVLDAVEAASSKKVIDAPLVEGDEGSASSKALEALLADDDVVENVEVVEGASSKVLEAPLVEDDLEVVEVVEGASSKVLEAPLVEDDLEVVDVVEAPSSKVLEASLVEDDVEAVDIVEAASSSKVLEAPLVEDIVEDVDVVEAASSSSVLEAPLVDDDIIEDVDVVEAASSSKVIDAPLVEDHHLDRTMTYHQPLGELADIGGKSAKAEDKQPAEKGEPSSGSSIDHLVEAMESGIDFSTVRPDSPSGAHSKKGLESDIDIDSILSEGPESSAIDLGGSGEKSALPKSPGPGSKHHTAAGDGAALITGEDSGEPAEVVGEDSLLDSINFATAGGPDDDDAVLVKPKKKGPGSKEETKVESGLDIQPLVGEGLDEETLVSEVAEEEDVVNIVPEEEEEKPAKPSKPSKKSREKELVGAGSGGRGGFMPFLFGGLLATVVLAGAGAAAWFLDLLPKGAAPVQPVAKIIKEASNAQKARELLDQGNIEEAHKLVKDAEDGPDSGVRGLVVYKKYEAEMHAKGQAVKASDPEVQAALEKMDKGDAKGAADEIRARLKVTEDLLAAAPKVDPDEVERLQDGLKKSNDELMKAQQAKDKALQAMQVLDKDLKATQAKLADLAGAPKGDGGNTKELEKMLADAKLEYNKLQAQVDALKKGSDSTAAMIDLLVGAKALDPADADPANKDAHLEALNNLLAAKNATENKLLQLNDVLKKNGIEPDNVAAIAKLGATRDALNKQIADLNAQIDTINKAGAPERQLDAMLAALKNRGMADPQELDTFKIYIDRVRGADSKADAATRVKALQALALIQRNQANMTAAAQTLDQAKREAENLEGPSKEKLLAAIEASRRDVSKPAAPSAAILEALAQANPALAEKHFNRGLDYFWSRNYKDAEKEFAAAASFYEDDARYHYFLGMARHVQGKKLEAEANFRKGVQLELSRHPNTQDVNASLERIQGELRKVLNGYREQPLVGG